MWYHKSCSTSRVIIHLFNALLHIIWAEKKKSLFHIVTTKNASRLLSSVTMVTPTSLLPLLSTWSIYASVYKWNMSLVALVYVTLPSNSQLRISSYWRMIIFVEKRTRWKAINHFAPTSCIPFRWLLIKETHIRFSMTLEWHWRDRKSWFLCWLFRKFSYCSNARTFQGVLLKFCKFCFILSFSSQI